VAYLTKPPYSKPIPAGGTIFTRNGQRFARWTTKKGKTATAPLTEDGQRVRLYSRCWYVVYRDADGIIRKVKGYPDKSATEQMKARLERQAARQQEGMVDAYAEHLRRPLSEQLDDFEKALAAKGNTAEYVKLTAGRIRALLAGCQFQRIGDIRASRVAEWLAEQRQQGMSVQTSNYYLTHIKGFCRWLVRDRRAPDTPLSHLQRGNVNTDRRHDRRELSVEELQKVLQAAQQSAVTFDGLTGPDRAALYATACGTGFRASELASLLPESFDLDTDPPTATVGAGYTKNKRLVVQPLPPDLAEMLRAYLAGKPTGQPVWPGTWAAKRHAAEMLRIDLKAAGVPYVIDRPDGPLYADFHALRHTYITYLDRGGVSLRTAQELARHSTPTLTARYSHPRLNDMASAAEKLPRFLQGKPEGQADALRATGTEGKLVAPLVVASRIPSHRDALPRTGKGGGNAVGDATEPAAIASLSTSSHSDASTDTALSLRDSAGLKIRSPQGGVGSSPTFGSRVVFRAELLTPPLRGGFRVRKLASHGKRNSQVAGQFIWPSDGKRGHDCMDARLPHTLVAWHCTECRAFVRSNEYPQCSVPVRRIRRCIC
jgi:integrase